MRTIPELFTHAAEIGISLKTDNGVVGVSDLEAESRRIAASLSALNVGPGDRVAAWLPNLAEYLCLYAATARLGAILVAVNNRFGAAEVTDIVGRSECAVLVAASCVREKQYAKVLAEIDAAALPKLGHLVLIGDAAEMPVSPWRHVSALSYGDLLDAAPLDSDFSGPETLSNIFTTSGTTAAPKFAAHAQAGVVGHARDVAAVLEMTAPESVSLQLLPFCGIFGFVQAIAALAAGVPIVFPSGFDADQAVNLALEHRATHMFATDDMVDRMIASDKLPPGDRPFPDLQVCAFAQFNSYLADLPARAEALGIPMVAPFGMSEVFSIFTVRRLGQPADDRHRAGGRVVSPTARVRVRDPETGEILPHGEVGEVEVSGPHIFKAYFGNPQATREIMTGDGYLRTGDLGYTENDQAFTYLQRSNDTLRLGGFLVNPAEIEAEVMKAPGISDAQVVAVGTPRGNRPVAFVIVERNGVLNEAQVITDIGARLPKFKTPVRVIGLEAFPVTAGANGTKVQRAKLREMASAALADM